MDSLKLTKLDYVALAAIACYVVAVLPFIPREIPAVTGSVLCFLLTGVTVAAAIFPRPVGGPARFAAVISCSLATGIIGGMLINIVPGGLVRFNWITYALLITLFAYCVARARGAGSELEFKRENFLPLTWASGVKLVAAAAILVATIVISVNTANHGEKPFTEVWFVPGGPTHSPVNATSAVFGMKSHESSSAQFTVVINAGSQTMTRRVKLAPLQSWTQAVSVDGERPIATVYRGDPRNPPYRTVWFATR
jgi:hypothetical protein